MEEVQTASHENGNGLLQDANVWLKAKEMLVLKKVLEKMPDVSFYWAGDGPYKDRILSELSKFKNFKHNFTVGLLFKD